MFKSKKQIALFAEKVKRGEIDQATFDEWMKATPNPHRLPETSGAKGSRTQMIAKIKTKKVK